MFPSISCLINGFDMLYMVIHPPCIISKPFAFSLSLTTSYLVGFRALLDKTFVVLRNKITRVRRQDFGQFGWYLYRDRQTPRELIIDFKLRFT